MICHIDADAFFASALERRRPELKGKPILALGMGGGCVIAASYPAKAKGVKTGMRMTEAKKLCPEAIALPSDFDEALLASKQIESILQNHFPIMQRYSVDEWFVDMNSIPGGYPKHPDAYIQTLQDTVLASTSLTVSIGVGSSKLLAKMASEYKKPAGLTIVTNQHTNTLSRQGVSGCGPKGRIYVHLKDFLFDRPAAAIPGIGKRRELHSEAHNWHTAWDIAKADQETIVTLFGRPGLFMQRELNGECIEPVVLEKAPPKSISRTRSFRKTTDREFVYAHLLHHLTYTMLKMRREGLACKLISVWLRGDSYMFEKKESKLPLPMDTEEQVLPYVHRCFEKLYEHGKAYTQIGLGLYGLNPKGGVQYCLFEDPKKTDEAEDVQQALDSLHKRYGRESLKRASALPVESAKKQRLGAVNEY